MSLSACAATNLNFTPPGPFGTWLAPLTKNFADGIADARELPASPDAASVAASTAATPTAPIRNELVILFLSSFLGTISRSGADQAALRRPYAVVVAVQLGLGQREAVGS